METAEPRSAVSAGLLGVPAPGPGLLDSDDDDCEAPGGIRPKSSPLPRRKSSTSEEEPEEGAPQREPLAGSCRRRRVSFADAQGLRLVLVKEFDSWDFPKPPGRDQGRAEGPRDGACYLSFPSPLPGPPEALAGRVRAQKIELESVELLPGSTALRGVVRVLNVSFHKAVFVRTSLDAWASHFDLLAEYVPGSSDGTTDRFAFKLTLVPPFGEQGARVDFCLRYETPVGTFWANNGGENYVVLCHQRAKDAGDEVQEEAVCRKGCLKASRQNFTTVENPSLEENLRLIERIIEKTKGVSRNAGDVKPTPVADSQSATSEEECHKLTVEISQKNASRRNRRRVARQAKVKELLSQRDLKPERATENKEKSFPEPPSDRARQGENSEKLFSGSLPCSDGPSARVKGNVSPAQSRESSVAERSGSVDAVDAADRGEATAARARQPRLEEKPDQGQHPAAFTAGANRQRPMESTGRGDRGSDNVCLVNSAGAESHSDGRLTASTEVPVTSPSGFTFGTVLAPLYPLVWGQGVKSENHNLADQLTSMRGLSRTGDPDLENSISLDLAENDEETPRISRDPFKSHDRKPMNTPLNDVPVEVGRMCGSAAPDTGTEPTAVDCQESEHERTGTPDNPRRTADEDTTLSDVNNDMGNACSNRAGLNHQGKAEKSPQAHGCQWKNPHEKQRVEAAAKAQTDAGEVLSEIGMHLNPTQALSQPRVLRDTTGTTPQTRLSPSASAGEIQAMGQQSRGDATTGFIHKDESNEQDGVVPTMTVSTANIHPQQGREIEQLEEQDPKCLMHPVVFEAADISVGDQGIPQLKVEPGCSAVDLSQETLNASLEVVEDPHNGGEESTNNVVDGDTTTTVEHEDTVDVSECIKVNRTSCTHPDMLVRGIGLTLVEKPVCMQAEAERGTSEDAATTQDYSPYEERIGDKNWEMMVEEEEKDPLDEVVGKEGDENGEKENNELEEEQTIAEQQLSEKTVESGKREHAETESEGHKHVCATEGRSGIMMATMEEVLVWEEQEVDEEKVKKYADHGTDDQNGACEEIKNKVRENLAEKDRKTQVEGEDKTERISVEVNRAGEGGMVVENVVKTAKNEGSEDTERPETRSHTAPNRPESDPSKPLSNVHEREAERATDKENSSDNETTCFQPEMRFISEEEEEEEEERSNAHSLHLTNGQSDALSVSEAEDDSESCAAEKGSLVFDEEPPVCHPTAEERDGDSSSSESDEEMELYMHLLRASPSPTQTLRSFPRDGGSGGKGSHTGKRHSIDRLPVLPPSSMPAISESENEEPLARIPDAPEETDAWTVQAEATPLPAQDNQEYEGDTTAQWTDALSGSNILKSLLYITAFVVFVVVAYHYDFLACFALYLLSIFWLVLPSRQTATSKPQ